MALSTKQEQMIRALDGELSGAALAELQAYLREDAQQAALYEDLRQADALLRNPPLVAAPAGLASRVMADIQAGKHAQYARPRRVGGLLAGGLALVGLVALPLLLVGVVGLVRLVAEPASLASLLYGLIQALGAISGFMEDLLIVLGNLIVAYPMIPALLLTAIPLLMLWGWLVWFLRERNRPVTVVVKVQTV